MLRLAAIVIVVGLVAACAHSDRSPKMGQSEYAGRVRGAPQSMVAAGLMDAQAAPKPTRMIVRTGSIEVDVEAPGDGSRLLIQQIEDVGGYVSDTRTTEDAVYLTARVPSTELETVLDGAAALGDEEHRAITGQDVTEAYSDIEAEIENLSALRDRLRVLLDKARNVEEVLSVERELTRVQTRLDSFEKRRRRMAQDVALSRVDITLNQLPEPRILGPVGLLYEGVKWVAIKLWVISP